MVRELRRKTYLGFFWAAIEQFGTSLLGFITQIILARLIIPQEFGILGLILIINVFGDVLSDSGMTTSLIRTENRTRKDYNTVFISNLVISILLYIIVVAFSKNIAVYYKLPILTKIIPLYSLGIILSSLFSIQNTILKINLNFKAITFSTLPAVIVSSCIGIILGYLGYGIYALILMYLSRLFIQTVLLSYLTKWLPTFNFDLKTFKKHFGFGNKLLIATILGKTAQNVTSLVIGKMFSIVDIGFYTRAENLRNFPLLSFTSVMEKVAYPVLAKMQTSQNRVIYNYKQLLSISTFAVSALMFYVLLISRPLIILLLTETWQSSIPFFRWLCIVGLFYPFGVFSHNIILIKGKSNVVLLLAFIMELLTIGGTIFFSKFSIIAIIQFTLFLQIIMFFITAFFISKLYSYKLWDQIKSFFSSMFSTLIAVLITYTLIIFFDMHLFSNYNQIMSITFIYFTILLVFFATLKNNTYIIVTEIFKHNIKSC